ncbi:MAG: glutamate mutase L [Candidatus Bathyarchaeota archaeon]|nr:glutamate mutase L [Candidatus Bathyarchaeota archaeon]
MADGKRDAFLIIDIGESTRAALVRGENGAYRLIGTGEAETTLEAPELDVTIGIRRAVEGLGKKAGGKLMGKDGPEGVRLLCSSGDGGGLYMMVAGVIGMISGESAQRAALGAGAHLVGVFSRDDPRPEYRLVETMRETRPDIFLLAGGTDGGAFSQVLEMAAIIKEADVKPRFGEGYKLPVIFAGNVEARKEIAETLTEEYVTRAVDNVRPSIERENLGPAKEAIYDSYMEHVITHSPGYERLAKWVTSPILPTQAATGKMLYAYAERRGMNLLTVNVGGSTTDIYSVYRGVFNRSLDAEVGLTYGAMNILKTVGVERIERWLPDAMDERKIRNMVGNMMLLQPRVFSDEERLLRGALAREAIRLGVEEHKKLASRLKGVTIARTIADTFMQSVEQTYLDMCDTQIIIGMGSAFTTTNEAAALLLDSMEPLYLTELYVDRAGLTPHAGMLLGEAPEAAFNLFTGETLQRLGTCLSPAGKGEGEAVRVTIMRQNGTRIEESIGFGEIKTLPLLDGEACKMEATAGKGFNLGKGNEKRLEATITGGTLGIIIDARGRPLRTPEKKETIKAWAKALSPNEARATGG